MITLILAAAAALVALWPAVPAAGAVSIRLPQLQPRPRRHAGYADALQALSNVRGRLLATDSLAEQERAAVNALTLALINGSDRE
jgi:hypothetical protein